MPDQVSAEELILIYILERLWRPGRALVSASITWREGRVEHTQNLDAGGVFAWWEGTRYTLTEPAEPDEPDRTRPEAAEPCERTEPDATADRRPLTRLERRIMDSFADATTHRKAISIARKLGRDEPWSFLRTTLKKLKVDGFLVEGEDGRGYWPAGRELPSNAA